MKNPGQTRLWCALGLLAACLTVAGCAPRPAFEVMADPTAAGPTPTPEAITFDFLTDPRLTPEPPATPAPSPTPEATAVPFSYYAPTVNMTFEELVGGTTDFGEMGDSSVIWPKGYPAPDTYKLIVDVQWQVVMAFKKDANGEYTVPVRYMLCSTGTGRITSGAETRRGTFKMLKPRVRFGHFLSGEAAQYWSLIRGRTYFHSVLYDEQNEVNTYKVESYNALGSKASHGCIRLTVPDARWIWYNISYDTVCEIRDGSKDDAQMAWIRSQLILPPAPSSQLKTLRAGQTPYTDNWRIEDVATDVPFVNEKQPIPADVADDLPDPTPDPNATPTPTPTAPPPAQDTPTSPPAQDTPTPPPAEETLTPPPAQDTPTPPPVQDTPTQPPAQDPPATGENPG